MLILDGETVQTSVMAARIISVPSRYWSERLIVAAMSAWTLPADKASTTVSSTTTTVVAAGSDGALNDDPSGFTTGADFPFYAYEGDNNWLQARGGGVFYVADGGTLNVGAFCKFSGNIITTTSTSFVMGGAILAVGSNVDIANDCAFTGNKVISEKSYAGAIFLQGSALTIGESCVFSNNEAKSGGAIALWGTTASVTIAAGGNFVNNVAVGTGSTGGVIYAQSGTANIASNSIFTSNEATAAGGAIHALHYATVNIGDICTFVGNTAGFGGAISAEAVTVTVGNTCAFTDNAAPEYDPEYSLGGFGGAISVKGFGTKVTVGNSCTFTDNQAAKEGGAIYASSASRVSVGASAKFANKVADVDGGDVFVGFSARVEFSEPTDFTAADESSIYEEIGGLSLKGCPAGQQGKQNMRAADCDGKITWGWPSADDCEPDSPRFTSCCSNCSAGEVSGGQLSCTPCASGSYQENVGQGACTLCGPGKYQDEVGQVACKQCEPGMYSDEQGMHVCKPCSPGFHSRAASAICTPCGLGDYSLSGWPECLPCPIGKYSSAGGTNCEDCEKFVKDTSTVSEGAASTDSCMCHIGQFLDDSKSTEDLHCEICAEGMVCESPGAVLSTIELNVKYWRTGYNSSDIRLCASPEACPGGRGDGNVSENAPYCSEGHRGAKCSVCAPNYAISAGGACELCATRSKSPIYIVLGVLTLLAVRFFQSRVIPCAIKRFGKALADDGGDVARPPTSPPTSNSGCLSSCRSGAKHAAKSLRQGLSRHFMKAKLLFATYQSVCMIPSQFNIQWPMNFMQFVDTGSIFNLNLISWFQLGCVATGISFYDQLYFMTLGPPFVMALLVLAFAFKRTGHYCSQHSAGNDEAEELANLKSSLASQCLAVIYFVYPTTSVTVFKVFFCEEFDNGEKLLEVDYSISCLDTTYASVKAYAYMCILVCPVGVPVLFYFLLWHARKTGEKELTRFLWGGYHDRAYFFEVFDCIRRLFVSGAPLFLLDDQEESRVAAAMTVAFVGVLIYINTKPFKDDGDNVVGIVCQIQLFMTFVAGLLFKSGIPGRDALNEKAFGVALMFINLFVILVVAKVVVVNDSVQDDWERQLASGAAKRSSPPSSADDDDGGRRVELQDLGHGRRVSTRDAVEHCL